MNFNDAKLKERYIIVKLLEKLPDYRFDIEENDYSKNDFILYNKNGKSAICELKCRTFEHNKYEEVFMEVKKLNNLLQIKENKLADKIYYINHFKDDVILFFDLDYILSTEIKDVSMNKITCLNSEKIIKEVRMLNINKFIYKIKI